MTVRNTLLGWHFVGAALRDGRPVPPDGEWLTHDEPIIPCARGLHASVLALDALTYAPEAATHICRVELGGEMVAHGNPVDKYAASERRILWRADPRQTLQHFARLCALDVAHLWDMPAGVRDWLETGDQALRRQALQEAQQAYDGRLAIRAAILATLSPIGMSGVVDTAQATEEVAGMRDLETGDVVRAAARAAQAARLEAMMLALGPGE